MDNFDQNDDKFDQFLKSKLDSPPPAPFGEKQRIWRQINEMNADAGIWSLRNFLTFEFFRKTLAPALGSVALLTLLAIHVQHVRAEAEIDRVLIMAISSDLDDLGDLN